MRYGFLTAGALNLPDLRNFYEYSITLDRGESLTANVEIQGSVDNKTPFRINVIPHNTV